ncbi:hypothetical protein FDB42_12115 [Clostridium botulinum]|nr:hypothetical protein [Clostridium botulinum]
MLNKSSVNNALDNIISELNYVKNGISDGTSKGELLGWIGDVEYSIEDAKDKFLEYADEVEDTENDFDKLKNDFENLIDHLNDLNC